MSVQFTHVVFFVQRQVANLPSGLFYGLSLLRNNNMAANLQRFTKTNGRRLFAVERGFLGR